MARNTQPTGTEEHKTPRIIALGRTDGFRYLGIKPPPSREELQTMPTVHGIGLRVMHGVSAIETYADGTLSIGFDTDRTPELRHDSEFVGYAEQVARHLGGATIHNTEPMFLGPGSVFGQIVDGIEPSFGQRYSRHVDE